MKEPVSCPNCGSTFQVGREKEGKRAKCPKCEQPFVISFPEMVVAVATVDPLLAPIDPAPEDFVGQYAPPPIRSHPEEEKVESVKQAFGLPQWAVVAIPTIVALIAGYFIGREHLRYQLKSAFRDAATAFSEGLKDAFPGSGKGKIQEPTSGPTNNNAAVMQPQPISNVATPIESIPAKPQVPQLTIGQTHSTKEFSIRLDSAKIEKVKLKQFRDVGSSKEPELVLAFTFINTDDRKILTFRDNQFMAGNFKLRDDVDNVIRGISFGIGTDVIGAIKSGQDIEPGSSANHIEVFSVPPPKTEFLVLTVDLKCVGLDEAVDFKIPATAVAK